MPPEQPIISPQTPLPQSEPYKFNFWETDPKRNFAPWFLTFCTILIIIGLGISGYFKYQAYQSYKYGLSIVEQTQKQVLDSPSISSAQPFNFAQDIQTYRNEVYGFEFGYPKDWVAKPEKNGILLYSPTNQMLNGTCQTRVDCTADIIVGYDQNPMNFKPQTYYGKDSALELFDNPTKDTMINVGGITAYKLFPLKHQGLGIVAIIPSDTIFIRIENAKPEFNNVQNQILSTFKFTTPSKPIITPQPPIKDQPVACTMDAMMCPDGSYVGRSGPKCEFVCP